MEGLEKLLQLSPTILNENNQRSWLIFSTDHTLNYLKTSDQGRNWSKEKVAVHETIESYAAAIDSENIIHIIYRNQDSRIMYLRHKNGKWEKQIIFSEKDGQNTGYFCLLSTKESLHLCYLTLDMSINRWRLVHHIKKGDLWEAGKILEEGSGLPENYAVLSAGQKNRIHMIQRRLENECYVLYYRTLDPETDLWNYPTQISHKNANHFLPIIFEDEQNQVHSLWIVYRDSEYKVVYRGRSSGGWPEGGWAQQIILNSNKMTTFPLPIFLLNSNGLTAYWKTGSTIYYRNSQDKGCNWGEMESNTIDEDSFVIRYAENPQMANRQRFLWLLGTEFPPHTFIPKLPGTFSSEPSEAIAREEVQSVQTISKEQNYSNSLDHLEPLENAFRKLEGYSDHLVKHASNLWEEKNTMKHILDKQQKQYSTFYRFAGEKVKELHQEITSRENDLVKMEKQLKDTIKNISEQLQKEKVRYTKERERHLAKILSLTEENRSQNLKIEKFKETIEYLKKELQKEEEKIQELRKDVIKLKEAASPKSSLWTKVTQIIYPSKEQ